MSSENFWANQIAEKISERKKFHYLDKKIPKAKEWSVKTSSSLSGVLHIGRLSDVIRTEAVFRSLKNKKFPSKLIYVAEDMDPLRKVPKGISSSFKKHIGMPVSDVPDQFGCHNSYAEHHIAEFFSVLEDFLGFDLKIYSMRKEYRKGNFADSALSLMKNISVLKEIINKFREEPLDENWSPWKPVCDKCGKLQTTVIKKVEGSKVFYECKDYSFETQTAFGCKHEGVSDIKKGNGKLVWKSEWASQWKRWNVCAEGAGKEYNAPNSAWFVNAEICEKILNFPMPEPIFYEHLLVDSKKMSASIGNVIYPKDWLSVSRPESLKYLYIKRIVKSRSFSWKDIPNLELELDRVVEDYFRKKKPENSEEFYLFSQTKKRNLKPLPADYALLSSLVQIFPDKKGIFSILKKLGFLKKNPDKETEKQLLERIECVKNWVEKYAPEEFKVFFIEKTPSKTEFSDSERAAFKYFSKNIAKLKTQEKIQAELFEYAKANNIPAKTLFQAFYKAFIGKNSGPKIGSLIVAFGIERVSKRLAELSS